MKSIEWFMCVLLAWIIILTISETQGFRIERSLTPLDKWLRAKQYKRLSNSVMHKRGCKGFPCMYTHMGGSAGNASIKKAKLMLLRECVADPSCFSIGKRSRNLDIKRSYQWQGERDRDADSEWETSVIPDRTDTQPDSFSSHYENSIDPDILEALYQHY